jgi:Tol biopolymer transport system component
MPCRLASGVLVTLAALLAVPGCGGSSKSRTEIAFVSTRDGDYAVYEMNADGEAERRLTEADNDPTKPRGLFFQVEPAWSPDGTRIAFASQRGGTFDIYVMNADGRGTRQLTSTKDDDNHPTWSPDGHRVAFARSGDIYVMDADGSNPRRISDETVEETEPAWSPSGDWIAYVRRTPGTSVREVWLLRPNGTGRRALTSQGATAYTPAWSPDASRVAFASNADSSSFEIHTIGIDGKGLRSVVPTAGDMFEPAWSPDGSMIAFSEGGAIFTVDLGGGDAEKLTDPANNDSSPAWNPRPPPEDG